MNRKSILTLWICCIVFLSSCGSDETPSTVNSITLNGSSFKILFPSLIGVSIGGQGHAGISFTSLTNSGLSKTLSIDFEYSPNDPISGSYSFPQAGSDRYLDDFLTNYTEINISGGGSPYSTELETGRITIQENGGDNYTVTIDLKMLDGKVFKGKYRGVFTVAFNNS